MRPSWIQGVVVISLAVLASCRNTRIKFSCSQLVLDRIDPYIHLTSPLLPPQSTNTQASLIFPGVLGTPHLHQLVGGNSLNATMDPADDRASLSTCTSCTFPDDFSNYWTAVLYFRARNGTYKRVKQKTTPGFNDNARGGGTTVYYLAPAKNPTNIVAFKKGFRMRNGDPSARDAASAARYRGIDFICLVEDDPRPTNRSPDFPDRMCPMGIITSVYFPPCWDGVNLDSPDHYSHVAWPAEGGFDEGGPCPASHPVKIPQLILEVRWDTSEFNDEGLWPEDGSQPFVWSFGGDRTGLGGHGDYVFGWRGDSLQRAFSDEEECLGWGNTRCELPTQTVEAGNQCVVGQSVKEEVNGWLEKMPGGVVVDGVGI